MKSFIFFPHLNKGWFYLTLFFIITAQATFSDPYSDLTPDKIAIDNFLTKTIKTYHIPGIAVAFVNSHGILFISGYGESSPGINITDETPFLLGSTTKMFTALAIMRMVETGKVELDAPVKKYLPEFKLATPQYENVITIHHLLNHTSGLSGAGMPGSSFGENSLEEELASLRKCSPIFAPGEKYEYFSSNYRLLGLVIERVSGMKYGKFLENEIFRPLGMASSHAGPEGVNNLASGHGQVFGFPLRREQEYRAGGLPSGFMVSTVYDIARFLADELRAGKGDSSVLNPETVKTTWLPPGNKKSGYAMGWLAIDNMGKTPFLAHAGSLENYQSFFYLNPELDLGFAFMMNQGGILPMMGGFSTLRNGLVKLMNNEHPENGTGTWPLILVSGVFLLVSVIEAFYTIRLKSWQKRAKMKKRWKQWIGLSFDLILSCLLLYFVITGGMIIYGMLPEIFLLMWIMIILGFFRIFIKTRIIMKDPKTLFGIETIKPFH